MTKRILIACLISSSAIFQLKSQEECDIYLQKIEISINLSEFDIREDAPSIMCEPILLAYLEGKGYLGDSTEYDTKEILRYLAKYGTEKETRESAINGLLQRNYRFNIGDNYSFDKSDFNQQARERLITLLRKQYTQEEEEQYIKYQTRYIFADTIYFAQLTYLELEKNKNLNYENTRDSIIADVLEEYKNELYNDSARYSIHLPLLMGWLGMKECIPLLDSIQNERGGMSTRIALARLGNKQYQQFFMEQEKIDLYTAFYIGTQDLIAKYGEELYSNEKRYFVMGPPDQNEQIPIVYSIILELQQNIANFPQLINTKVIWTQKHIDALPAGVLEEARRWMKENKGNYIISENLDPEF